MSAIVSWWRAFKLRLDRFNGLGPVFDDEDDALSDLDRLNFELAEIAFRQQVFNPPEIEPKE